MSLDLQRYGYATGLRAEAAGAGEPAVADLPDQAAPPEEAEEDMAGLLADTGSGDTESVDMDSEDTDLEGMESVDMEWPSHQAAKCQRQMAQLLPTAT